jgi:hypothetical protein
MIGISNHPEYVESVFYRVWKTSEIDISIPPFPKSKIELFQSV